MITETTNPLVTEAIKQVNSFNCDGTYLSLFYLGVLVEQAILVKKHDLLHKVEVAKAQALSNGFSYPEEEESPFHWIPWDYSDDACNLLKYEKKYN